MNCRRQILAFAVLLGLAAPAPAAVVISWSDPSVVVNTINSQSATVTGNTTGDVVTPFLITISTVSTNQALSLSGPLGNQGPPILNLELPGSEDPGPPRTTSTLMTVNISIPGYTLGGASFTLLDIDINPGNASGWQDELIFTSPSVTMTSVNPAFTTVTGQMVRGIAGNVPNGSTDGNVNVSAAAGASAIVYTYGPGPLDGLESNQRHGLSNITFVSIVPEPSTLAAGAVLVCVAGVMVMRRRGRTA